MERDAKSPPEAGVTPQPLPEAKGPASPGPGPAPQPKPNNVVEVDNGQIVVIAELGQRPAAATAPDRESVPRPTPSRRHVRLPLILFVATCFSTFFVGMSGCDFLGVITEPLEMLRRNWWQGAIYMLAVMGILLAHEMGHFLQAVRYGVPASLPFFIPLPISPLGTMGAVIALGGSQADRKQLFDIGLTGPLAGLVLALPLTYIGLLNATPLPAWSDVSLGGMRFGDPLIFKILVAWLRPDLPDDSRLIVFSNPLVVAGWAGMLVTGLNMMPVGQLDGGHVAYALMGKRAYWLARIMVLVTIVFMIVTFQVTWLLMLSLVVWLGIRHPPTANDRVELGRGRAVLGWFSLLIPLFCFPPFPLIPTGPGG